LRPVSINQVTPGMVVGRTIYSGDGRVLLKNGVALKRHYIDRLIEMGIDLLYVLDERFPDVYVEDVVHQETRIAALTTVSQLMSSARSGKALSSLEVRRVVEEIVSEVVRNPASLIQLTEIRALNDYTFGHCVSVSVLSLVAGVHLRLPRPDLLVLGTGAMLHDIGKMMIPSSFLINKEGALSPVEFHAVKQHTTYGYEVLSKVKELPDEVGLIALNHHERIDGSGYPQGLVGDEMGLLSQITTVCDVYDALTTKRPYRGRYLPHEAVAMLAKGRGTQYKEEAVDALLSHIAVYPVGTSVVLNNGVVGLVTEVSKNAPGRPIIRVTEEGDGWSDGDIIDLQKHRELGVVKAHW